MAFHASRLIAVLGVVTIAACHFAVCAGILGYFSGLGGVAVGTILFQGSHVAQSGNRHVRIAMAAQAVEECRTVDFTVAGGALGNYVSPVFVRAVGMERLVAELAVQLMFAAFVTDDFENGIVATGTIER